MTSLGRIGLSIVVCASLYCGDSTPPAEHPAVALVLVRPENEIMPVNYNVAYYAIILDSAGDTLIDREVTWNSSDSTIVGIAPWGLAHGRAPGAVTITATADSVSGHTGLRVLIPVSRVLISPNTVMLVPGGRFKLTATLTGADGTILSDRDVAWNHQTHVSITVTGMTSALLPGRDSITASSEGIASANYVTATVAQPQFTRVISNGLADHTCALTAAAEPYCWGANSSGELGNGTYGDGLTGTGGLAYPTGIPFLNPTSLAIGEAMSCAVYSAQVACWGFNDENALGTSAVQRSATPLQVFVDRPATAVVAAEEWACALGTDSIPYCWGGSVTGFLYHPTAVSSQKYVSIVAGYKTLCGIAADSLAYCGFPQTSGQPLVSASLKFTKLSIGFDHLCGIASDSTAYCWGQNTAGQLGDSTTTAHAAPAAVSGGRKFVDIAAGQFFTCGVATAGSAYCWGVVIPPQTPTTITTAPSPVPGGLTFSQITAGYLHACGLSNTGKVYCWGHNLVGQLGDGTTTDRSAPTLVAGQQP
jgi:hypothetical protein